MKLYFRSGWEKLVSIYMQLCRNSSIMKWIKRSNFSLSLWPWFLLSFTCKLHNHSHHCILFNPTSAAHSLSLIKCPMWLYFLSFIKHVSKCENLSTPHYFRVSPHSQHQSWNIIAKLFWSSCMLHQFQYLNGDYKKMLLWL